MTRLAQGVLPPTNAVARRSNFVPSKTELTEMQKRFCQEYMIDLDPMRAAIRTGYPPDRAAAAGAAILKHPPAANYLAQMLAVRSARVGLNADRVLVRLGEMINGDPGDLFLPDGSLKPIPDMRPADRMLISGVKTQRRIGKDDDGKPYPEIVTELKLVPREVLVGMAMRHFGMFNDKTTVEHTSLADRLREAQLRRDGVLPGGQGIVIEGEIVPTEAHDPLAEPDDEGAAWERQLSDVIG